MQVLRKMNSDGRFGVLALGCILAVAGCGSSGGGGGGGGMSIAPSTSGSVPGTAANLTAIDLYPQGDIAIFGSLGVTTGNPPQQQVIVAGFYKDAAERDLTRSVTYVVADPTVAKISGDGLITPVNAGRTTVTVTQPGAGGQTLTLTRNIIVSPNAPNPSGAPASSLELYPGPVIKMTDVNPTTGADQFQQFVVLVRFPDGTCMDLTRNFGCSVQDSQGNPTVAARMTTGNLLRATDNATVSVVADAQAYNMTASVTVVCGTGGGAGGTSGNGFNPYTGGALAGSTNPIDVTALAALKAQNIEPAKLSNDNEFLRRVTADLIGRLPTPAEYSAFLASTSPTKRADTIAALIAMPDFGMHWANDIVGAWTMVGTGTGVNMAAFNTELTTELNADTPLSTVMTNMATGTGPLGTNFMAQFPMAYMQSDNLMLTWTGMTSKCAGCHNHHLTTPLDDPMWLQNDNYSLYAFFAQSATDATEIDINGKPVIDPTTNKPVVRQPGWVVDGYANAVTTGLPALTDPIATRQAKFASLLGSSNAFARGTGHRIWSELMAPLLDPNQFLQANLAAVVNPKQLATIATEFANGKTSLKAFVSEICNSKLYQLTTAAASTKNDGLLARHVVRRHHSEVLNQGVSQIAGVAYKSDSFFAFNFGYPATRLTLTERTDAVNMGQAFTLMNSTHATSGLMVMTGNQIDALAKSVDAKTTTMEAAITTIFNAGLQRDPSATELAAFMNEVSGAATSQMFLEDVAVAVGASVPFVMR
ncbi:MAG TPA: DUF1549 domain-containing protein [Planctomycetota bacterium]|nr:DUF1549 domain-containing protein [Planctomycetota bacterium]